MPTKYLTKKHRTNYNPKQIMSWQQQANKSIYILLHCFSQLMIFGRISHFISTDPDSNDPLQSLCGIQFLLWQLPYLLKWRLFLPKKSIKIYFVTLGTVLNIKDRLWTMDQNLNVSTSMKLLLSWAYQLSLFSQT